MSNTRFDLRDPHQQQMIALAMRQIAAVRAIGETEDGWEYERLVAERNQAHQELIYLATGVCRMCGAELVQPKQSKQRRMYCSHRCRQRAYRQRQVRLSPSSYEENR